jgi:hypothetical protein
LPYSTRERERVTVKRGFELGREALQAGTALWSGHKLRVTPVQLDPIGVEAAREHAKVGVAFTGGDALDLERSDEWVLCVDGDKLDAALRRSTSTSTVALRVRTSSLRLGVGRFHRSILLRATCVDRGFRHFVASETLRQP